MLELLQILLEVFLDLDLLGLPQPLVVDSQTLISLLLEVGLTHCRDVHKVLVLLDLLQELVPVLGISLIQKAVAYQILEVLFGCIQALRFLSFNKREVRILAVHTRGGLVDRVDLIQFVYNGLFGFHLN